MARRNPDFDLMTAVADAGFTPGQRDIGALLDLLTAGPKDSRKQVEAALRRAPELALHAALARKEEAPDARARIVGLVGRLSGVESPAAREVLLTALTDSASAVRRRAADGLGRAREDETIATALSEALSHEADPLVATALLEALGKVGGPVAEKALTQAPTVEGALPNGRAQSTPDTESARSRARVRAARPTHRQTPSFVDLTRSADALPGGHLHLWLAHRRGLAPLILEEIPDLKPTIEHRADGSAVVGLMLKGPLQSVFQSRIWTDLVVPGAKVPIGGDIVQAAAKALAQSGSIAAALTSGPVRYRIAWATGGKRRGLVYDIAAATSELAPNLINDSTAATWEALLRETKTSLVAEWTPTLSDPRFAYRKDDVPAASHPTIAAALTFVAGAQPDDVVWDPFVGSGLELCERSRRGPYQKLVGTDVAPEAIAATLLNLKSCGAHHYDVRLHDAELGPPKGIRPSLIVTNPPLGRRVHRRPDLRAFLQRVMERAVAALLPGGRFVWISPFPGDTRSKANALGLKVTRCHVVDLGGFEAEIQVFTKPA